MRSMRPRWARRVPWLLALCLAGAAPLGWARVTSAAPAAAPAAPTGPEKPGGKDVALPLFKQGIALFDSGDYYGAIQKFSKAYFHFPSPKIDTRIALCYKWLRNWLKAAEHYERYLVATKPKTAEEAAKLPEATKKLREDVAKTLTELLKNISQLKLAVRKPPGAELRINGRAEGRGPLEKTFRFNPGLVVVEVTAKDHTTFRQELKLVAGQTVSLQITLDRTGPSNRGGGAAADSL